MKIVIKTKPVPVDDHDPAKGVRFDGCSVTIDTRDCGPIAHDITATVFDLTDRFCRLRWNVREGTKVVE